MSNSAAPNRHLSDLDPRIGLMFTVADHLIPLFVAGSVDVKLARQMAVCAIEAYDPETRADYVNVARTIAFSISALALLGQAAAQDMTMPERMRAFGRANALNRSADQSERTMIQRRRHSQANPRAQRPAQMEPRPGPPAPDPELDAAVDAAVAETMDACRAARILARTNATAPETTHMPPLAALVAPLPAPMPGIVERPVAAAPAAIRYDGPTPGGAQPRSTPDKARPYREELLRHSAMPHEVVEQRAASYPV
jgi:hypothetical protein